MTSSGNHQYTIPSKDLDWWSEDATVRFGTNTQKTNEPAWQDVGANVLRMDSLYDASFHDWLKCEDNVTIIASYLQRIANEYPMDRIINALRWLVSSWRVESTATIVRHITAEWAVSPNAKPSTSAPFRLDAPQTTQQADPAVLAGEARRGLLVRELTKDWTCQQIAQLVGMLSLTFWGERNHLEAFLRTLVSDWDFCRLSSFFSYISGQLGLDYRVKVSMLQQAARRNAARLSLKRPRNNLSRSAVAGNSAENEDSGSNKRIRHEAAAASAETGGPSAHAAEPPMLGSETNSRSDSTPQSVSTSPAEHATLVHSPAMASHATASVSTSPSFVSPGASEPSALSTRAAQRGRRPAHLTTQTPQYSTSTTPSSPAASAHRRATPMDTDMHDESDSESLELTTAPLSATASSGHLSGPREHEQRRRPRSGTGRSPTMPSTSSPLVSGSYSEQAPTADIVTRRPLTPQISSGTYAARSDAQSPTRRRQHRDCTQALTPTHSSASLAALAAPSDQEASTSGLPSRPAMRLHAASVSAGGEPQSRNGNDAVVETTQSSQQQQQQQQQQQSHLQQPREQLQAAHAEEQAQEYRARTSSESEMGQFDGPPSTHLALPLPSSETAGNAPSLCGRASATAAAPYDVLGIVMADSEHHISGSSA
ncbi:hypothetical protein EV183_003428 [Coemansia sp. RSA 2336]|nr:hypothetical protein EV183_003428 [Coemansia sp. RSA 2336]